MSRTSKRTKKPINQEVTPLRSPSYFEGQSDLYYNSQRREEMTSPEVTDEECHDDDTQQQQTCIQNAEAQDNVEVPAENPPSVTRKQHPNQLKPPTTSITATTTTAELLKTETQGLAQMILEMQKMQLEGLKALKNNQRDDITDMLEVMKKKDKVPPPRKMEQGEDLQDYIDYFKITMEAREIPVEYWAHNIVGLLTKTHKAAIAVLDPQSQVDWVTVERTLLLTLGTSYRQAAQSYYEYSGNKGDNFHTRVKKLATMFDRMTKDAETFEQLREITIAEKFISTLPYKCQSHIREKRIQTMHGAAEEAELWFASHRHSIEHYLGHGKWAESTKSYNSPKSINQTYHSKYQYSRQPYRKEYSQQQESSDTQKRDGYQQHKQKFQDQPNQQCERQDYQGQRSQQRQLPQQDRQEQQQQPYPLQRTTFKQQSNQQQSGNPSYSKRPPVTCWKCNKQGHRAFQCRSAPSVNRITRCSDIDSSSKAFAEGVVAGIPIDDIRLDTGADISVVAQELLNPDIPIIGGTLVKGATGPTLQTEVVEVPIQVKGESFELEAAVLPRDDLGNSVLLGNNCPGLDFNWSLNRQKLEIYKQQKQIRNQEQLTTQTYQKDHTNVNILTHQQKRTQEEELAELERLDSTAECKPTPLGGHDSAYLEDSQEAKLKKKRQLPDIPLQRPRKLPATPTRDNPPTDIIQPSLPLTDLAEGAVTREQLRELQQQDPTIISLLKDDTTVSEFQGIIYKTTTDRLGESKKLIVVPQKLKKLIYNTAHATPISGHVGATNTKMKICQHFYWPGMSKDIAAWARECTICQKGNDVPGNKAPLQLVPIISEPWGKIALDVVGPLKRTVRGHKYILTCICHATRYPEAQPLKSITTKAIVTPLVEILSRHGIPKTILTDNGSDFVSALFKELCTRLGITKIESTAYRPQSNGVVERFHATFKRALAKMPASETDWDLLIPYILFALRECPSRATGYTPFTLVYGREVRGPLTILTESWKEPVPENKTNAQYLNDLRQGLNIAQETALECERNYKQYNKQHYDKQGNAPPLQIGDEVLVKSPTEPKGMHSQWKGPFTVLNKPSEVTYVLDVPARGTKNKTFHRNSIKPYIRQVNHLKVVMADEAEGEPGIPLGPLLLTEPTGYQFNLDTLDESQKMAARQLFHDYQEIFNQEPGEAEVPPMVIRPYCPHPITSAPYGVPHHRREALEKEIASLLKSGIIEPSTSLWASPVVLVDKPDGSLRLCVNYKLLNAVTEPDEFPLPSIEDMIQKAAASEWISTIDFSKGYHQVPMEKESVQYTAFVIPTGKFQYTKMPFGLRNAPSHFQRIVTTIFAKLANVMAYIDDILVPSQTFQQHLQHLQEVFDIIREKKLTIKPPKSKFFQHEVEFLGHKVGRGLISPQQVKVVDIQNYFRPMKKKNLRSFLGLTNYYRRFVPHYSDIASPLYVLTSKQAPDVVQWTSETNQAFNQLRTCITEDSVLIAPDFTKSFTLTTDASYSGVGAVLSQPDEDQFQRPVAFFSKQLTKAEKNYSVTELELLTVVKATEHFQIYLLGNSFHLETDHKALLALEKLFTTNKRLTRWSLILSNYTFDITYRPGHNNTVADALSRQEWSETEHDQTDNEDEPPEH